MKFISEEIRSEDDKEYYYSLNPTNLLGERMEAYWWAIDRNSGDFLYMRCIENPAYGVNSCFGLFVEKEQILLEVLENSEGRISQNNIVQTWRIIEMQIPQAILSKGYTLNDINCLVKEAFVGLGRIGYERSKIKEVNVYIDVEAEII